MEFFIKKNHSNVDTNGYFFYFRYNVSKKHNNLLLESQN